MEGEEGSGGEAIGGTSQQWPKKETCSVARQRRQKK